MNFPQFELPRIDLPAEVEEILGPEESEMLRDEIAQRTAAQVAAHAFREGLSCALGRERADLVIADQFGEPFEFEAALTAVPSWSRATASRVLNQCRRNRGLPVRCPGNARPDGGWPTRRANAKAKAETANKNTKAAKKAAAGWTNDPINPPVSVSGHAERDADMNASKSELVNPPAP